ncbi:MULTISPECIES: FAD-dependent monooxygenase [unclassified Bradyrhizobium]|uniref:FAD-dependent monooxygenase n=1 Tax=unclassified Bradyrhizobium TaxID=2631580 RepID=UPI001BA90165|nr:MULTISPECIES: FAD-dependent monooxygenase [unclassified Bradyrhizobium]MBR1204350.1 FAD-dependent monooxygenase [Bradyrhizobium sp. AUGA SZCCT0124]MBR1309764.1 FAD-dependent monooxygenase [Bradyrhizobium sp. AUGA SZCCT0051]MBR1339905.1 FAD-dependent monooxygenase [Bradyrhizobium sp. AUGA SZCCT0105]MBR1354512.1 FAD-dependent monooxygenase [Bradyrhizobium sp. AUGA SZCCT0045]
MALTRTVIVAGAGIGGLTASLALAAQGFRVVVLEKAERLEEAGAGIQLSPNASRILVKLGLKEPLARRVVTPESVNILSARAGGEIARMPLGRAAEFRAGAPYWVIHRADLQAALQAAVNDHPDIDLRLGCQFEDVTKHAKGLTVVQRRGNARQEELAVALIGADGIWSSVRGHLFPDVQPQFSGLIAWRGTLDATALPREYTAPRVQLWMGPDAHLVAYPISAGRQVNVVAIVSGTWNRPGWSAPGDINEIKGAFATARWPATARMLIGAVDGWRKWALFTLPDIGRWNEGAVTLLGDAAHAMLPFAAQGAGMAIEDAAVLAKALADCTGENTAGIPAALKRYAEMRRGRVLKVQRMARQQGRIYHLSGPLAIARDLAIRAIGPQRMLARQDWIYDWRA